MVLSEEDVCLVYSDYKSLSASIMYRIPGLAPVQYRHLVWVIIRLWNANAVSRSW
jgi:hypothetical protein